MSKEGSIWSRIVCLGQGFGPIEEMTTAQVLFAGLAGMEDAQITAGNGLVKRGEEIEGGATSTAEYFAAKRALTPGTPEFEELRKKAAGQQPLRRILEGKIKKLALEDMRYR